jgi:hypothetical protein
MTPVALFAVAFFLVELMFPAKTDRGELFFRTEPDVMPEIPEQKPPESTAVVE